MPQPLTQPDESALRALRCKEGDATALAELRKECHGPLLAVLRARGAGAAEAEDILADLWADCVPGQEERPSLLEKFSGRTTLARWLATVATNRWLDFKRRQARAVPLPEDVAETGLVPSLSGQDGALGPSQPEATLTALLRQSLEAAFARCSPEALVLLRLVYLHGVSQREVGRMLRWSESKTSRFLSEALQAIERETLAEMRRRDGWLDLTWQDFVEACETLETGFL